MFINVPSLLLPYSISSFIISYCNKYILYFILKPIKRIIHQIKSPNALLWISKINVSQQILTSLSNLASYLPHPSPKKTTPDSSQPPDHPSNPGSSSRKQPSPSAIVHRKKNPRGARRYKTAKVNAAAPRRLAAARFSIDRGPAWKFATSLPYTLGRKSALPPPTYIELGLGTGSFPRRPPPRTL